MKMLVRLIQGLIVVVMSYPVFYIWEINKIDSLCQQIGPGMQRDLLVELLDATALKTKAPEFEHPNSVRWTAFIHSRLSFAGYHCEIRGSAHQVASARIHKTVNP